MGWQGVEYMVGRAGGPVLAGATVGVAGAATVGTGAVLVNTGHYVIDQATGQRKDPAASARILDTLSQQP
jgi:hypothetical protein